MYRIITRMGVFGTAITSVALVSSAAAATTVIEGWQHPPNDQLDVGRTLVRAGVGDGRYRAITTETVKSWIVVDGHAPNRDEGGRGATITIGGHTHNIDSPTSRAVYRVDFPFERPPSKTVVGQRMRVAQMCNDRLQATSGAARTAFLREGTTFRIAAAYPVELKSTWMVRPKKRGTFQQPAKAETWENSTALDLYVRCPPLDRNAGAVRTNPEDTRPQRSNPDAGPRRSNPGEGPQRANPGG